MSVKIAIIGSGPGGLILARLLQKGGVPFTLYERDSSPDERNQGGSLDLHSGQVALRAAGLIEEFTKLARFEADCTKLIAPDGTFLLNEAEDSKGKQAGPPERSRPEIDRVVLRDMLLSSLNPGTVQYGHKLHSVEPCTDSSSGRETYTLDFTVSGQDVKKGPFDVVIGADGASSRVRPLLTDSKLFYSGVTAIELWALDVDNRHPWLASYVGPGNCWMFDQDRAVFAQRNGNGSIRVYACVKRAEDWSETCGIDWSGSSSRQQLVEKEFADCGEDVKKVIIDADDQLVLRRLEMLPVGITWPRRGGVTLLGDAAHVMTPFAGEGVNSAMQDAHELSEAIVRGVGKGVVEGVIEELGVYERGMFERTRGIAQQTWDQMQGMCFSKDGAGKFLEMMASGGGPPEATDESSDKT